MSQFWRRMKLTLFCLVHIILTIILLIAHNNAFVNANGLISLRNLGKRACISPGLLAIRGGKSKASRNVKKPIVPSSKKSKGRVTLIKKVKTWILSVFDKFGKSKAKNRLPSKHVSRRSTNSQNIDTNVRLHKEAQEFLKNPPSHCKLHVINVRNWIVTIQGVNGTVYEGETFKLRFTFPETYPNTAPIVYFLQPSPRHVHVYSNGDICLSILGKGWMPSMTAEGIAVSVLSMLSSAKEKRVPPDNAMHIDQPPGRVVNWMYHDDKC